MANNFQNVTLSLTLPISCQICLGKVRQPVICANNHVFCSCCMDIWLKKASQCPSCRVPITSENPCRQIIGGTNESESNESYSVKKHLRKTRGELLLREYEDEMEGLLKENEDLRNKNQSLESQLKTVLDPCTVTASRREDRGLEPSVVEDWSNKLRAATDGYSWIKLDVEKLKEANKMLRCQTIDLVQKNVRLKAEVASRSPQKYVLVLCFTVVCIMECSGLVSTGMVMDYWVECSGVVSAGMVMDYWGECSGVVSAGMVMDYWGECSGVGSAGMVMDYWVECSGVVSVQLGW
eukprot:XP_014039336.1 PREDICTED: RING finger protein 219-like [Salmo salar]